MLRSPVFWTLVGTRISVKKKLYTFFFKLLTEMSVQGNVCFLGMEGAGAIRGTLIGRCFPLTVVRSLSLSSLSPREIYDADVDRKSGHAY